MCSMVGSCIEINLNKSIVNNWIRMKFRLKRHIRVIYTYWQLCKARVLNILFGFEHVVLLIRRLDKYSTIAILRHFGASIGDDCDIESGLNLHNAKNDFTNLFVENECHIGKDVFLDLAAPIILRARTTISMRTTIITHLDIGHSQIDIGDYSSFRAEVEIGPDVYIGAGATILAGVQIGLGSVIGAGTLVNRDVPPKVLAAGVPVKVIEKSANTPYRETGVD